MRSYKGSQGNNPMKPLAIFHIVRYDEGQNTFLEGFTGRDLEETYDRADRRLDYWWAKYPNAATGIERKA